MGVVYFIRSIVGGPIKIGFSGNSDVKTRVSDLQVASPTRLHVLATLPVEDASGERALHRQFQALKIRGEWFHADSDLLAYIAALPTYAPPRLSRSDYQELIAARRGLFDDCRCDSTDVRDETSCSACQERAFRRKNHFETIFHNKRETDALALVVPIEAVDRCQFHDRSDHGLALQIVGGSRRRRRVAVCRACHTRAMAVLRAEAVRLGVVPDSP